MVVAREAERLGFDGLALPDHLFFRSHRPGGYPYSDDGLPPFKLDAPWPDVFTMIAAMAVVTERLRFRTSVYVLPLRHPAVVGRALGTAAVISGNRVDLGLGVGHNRDEFEMVQMAFHNRGARTDESMEVVRKLLGPGPVEHHGRFYDFGPVNTAPVPSERVPDAGARYRPARAVPQPPGRAARRRSRRRLRRGSASGASSRGWNDGISGRHDLRGVDAPAPRPCAWFPFRRIGKEKR